MYLMDIRGHWYYHPGGVVIHKLPSSDWVEVKHRGVTYIVALWSLLETLEDHREHTLNHVCAVPDGGGDGGSGVTSVADSLRTRDT